MDTGRKEVTGSGLTENQLEDLLIKAGKRMQEILSTIDMSKPLTREEIKKVNREGETIRKLLKELREKERIKTVRKNERLEFWF